jgi:prefoldin subunit 5
MNYERVLELIATRETVAGAQAEQLRAQIAALTEQLVAVDAKVADLATTRSTLLRLTGTTSSTSQTDPTTDATVASPAYQQILAVFTATGNPLRAKDICVTLGTGTAAKNTESLRAKLKRLVARGVLTEPESGLFALAQPTTSNPDPTPES